MEQIIIILFLALVLVHLFRSASDRSRLGNLIYFMDIIVCLTILLLKSLERIRWDMAEVVVQISRDMGIAP